MSVLIMDNHLDDRNQAILNQRIDMLNKVSGPRVGDFVWFADNIVRRISYIWGEGMGAEAQTSDEGSFYLGEGYVSFSGGLYSSIPVNTFTLTEEARLGTVWFFRNDFATAHNGIDAMVPFRVYRCSKVAPR